MVRPRHIAWLFAVSLLASTPAAMADGPDVEAAERAFDQAMELMKASRFPEACAKFEASQRLEAGMATQFRLAQCYEKDGRIASAWKNFTQVANAARSERATETDAEKLENLQAREQYALQRADALIAMVSKLQIQVPAEVASLAGLEVTIDGVLAQPSEWGGVPVDKGSRKIVASADGKQPWITDVAVERDGEALIVRVPALEQMSEQPKDPVDVPIVSDTREGMHPLAITGIVVGAVGLAGMGAGVALGVAAKSKHEDSEPECNGDDECTPEGIAIRDDARGLGDIGTGVFIAGAVLAAGGLIMFIASPSSAAPEAEPISASIVPLPGGAYGSLGVRF